METSPGPGSGAEFHVECLFGFALAAGKNMLSNRTFKKPFPKAQPIRSLRQALCDPIAEASGKSGETPVTCRELGLQFCLYLPAQKRCGA